MAILFVYIFSTIQKIHRIIYYFFCTSKFELISKKRKKWIFCLLIYLYRISVLAFFSLVYGFYREQVRRRIRYGVLFLLFSSCIFCGAVFFSFLNFLHITYSQWFDVRARVNKLNSIKFVEMKMRTNERERTRKKFRRRFISFLASAARFFCCINMYREYRQIYVMFVILHTSTFLVGAYRMARWLIHLIRLICW